MDILYQFDEKYAPYAGISVVSLLEHNAAQNVTIYLAAMEISQGNLRKFEAIGRNYGAEVVWLKTEQALNLLKTLGAGAWNGSRATWLKMLVLDQLPDEVDRVLYLDCDTLVLEDLSELFGCDLHGNEVGACLDSVGQHHAKRLGVLEYYNAGVILFDLKKMRGTGQIEGMKECLNRNVSQYLLNDQDLLNDYFAGRIERLPLRYNVQGFHFLHKDRAYFTAYHDHYYESQEVAEARKKPTVLHFFRILGSYPWEKGNMHPCRDRFLYYKAKSPWSDIPDLKVKLSWVFTANRLLYLILPDRWYLKLYRKVTERG